MKVGYSFLYVLIFSIALILIQKLDLSVPPLFSLCITASIASLYFNIINIKHFKKIYKNCLNNKKEWFLVMLIVLIMWATTMEGPGKIGASLFNFIYFAWLGMLGFVLSFNNKEEYKVKCYFGACLLLLIVVNVFFELQTSFCYETIFGIILALAGGTSSFIYFKRSQLLAKEAQLSATQVLSIRFYLSIFVLFIVLPKHSMATYMTFNNFISIVLLAFLTLIMPLYCSQKALERITPEQHAIINSLCPIVTGILEEFVFKDLKIEQISIYFLYTLVITSFYLVKKYNKKMELSK